MTDDQAIEDMVAYITTLEDPQQSVKLASRTKLENTMEHSTTRPVCSAC